MPTLSVPQIHHCLRHAAIICILLVALTVLSMHTSKVEISTEHSSATKASSNAIPKKKSFTTSMDSTSSASSVSSAPESEKATNIRSADTEEEEEPVLLKEDLEIVEPKSKENTDEGSFSFATSSSFQSEEEKSEKPKHNSQSEIPEHNSHQPPPDTTSTNIQFTTIQGMKAGQQYQYQYRIKQSALEQMERYRGLAKDGTSIVPNSALMLLVHLEHNAGRTFCQFMKELLVHPPGVTPSFVCRGVTPRDKLDPEDFNGWGLILSKHKTPWYPGEDTNVNIQRVHKYFHMIAQFYSEPPTATVPLADADWEHPDLLSVILMRDPIERLLSGVHEQADIKNNITLAQKMMGNHKALWEFATKSPATDNSVLRILAGTECCNGADTERKYLDIAKKLLSKISILVDVACLEESLKAMEDMFNLTRKVRPNKNPYTLPPRPSAQERIGDPKVYQYLVERNKLELELYQWSKSIALIHC